MLTMTITALQGMRARRFMAASPYQKQLKDLPPTLFDYWAASARYEFKDIPRDVFFFARAAEALMNFFDCAATSKHPCGLPSKAADSVWHAWLRFAPAGLEAFCRHHFGRAIVHMQHGDMAEPIGLALAACLVRGRVLAGLRRGQCKLPPLFDTDRKLGMPHGYGYRTIRGEPALTQLDQRGRLTTDTSFPPSLSSGMLVAVGLIRQFEVETPPKRKHDGDGGDGGGCSSDGGCSCGSDGGGCGSGCGGGCGGD